MKRVLCVFLVLMSFAGFACAENKLLGVQENGCRLAVYEDDAGRRFQIITETGEAAGEKHPYIGIFKDNLAIYRDAGYGVLNRKGEEVIPPVYDCIEYMRDGVFCAVSEEGMFLLSDQGETVFFAEGAEARLVLGDYVIYSEEKGTGIVLFNGQVYLEPEWDEVDIISCGIVMAYNQDGECCYVNASGEIIFKCETGMRFENDKAFTSDGGVVSLIDTDGRILFTSTGNISFSGCFADGLCPAKDATMKYGYVGTDGQWVIPPTYDIAFDFEEGYAVAGFGDKMGLINTSGETVLDFIWDFMNYGEGFVCVEDDHLWGVVTSKGETVSPVIWEDMSTFHEGLCPVRKDGLWGFINQSGELAIPCQYKDINYVFENGIAVVKDDMQNMWQINTAGCILSPIEFYEQY